MGLNKNIVAESPPQITPAEVLSLKGSFFKRQPFTTKIAVEAFRFLMVLEQAGEIDKLHYSRVLEFGAGFGDATIALNLAAKRAGGGVDVVEIKSDRATSIAKEGILPPDRILIGDGISHLASSGPDKYDLVFAYMFGPDNKNGGVLFRDFLIGSSLAMSEYAKVVASSDLETMNRARIFCNTNEIRYTWVTRAANAGFYFPDAMVVDLPNAQKAAETVDMNEWRGRFQLAQPLPKLETTPQVVWGRLISLLRT